METNKLDQYILEEKGKEGDSKVFTIKIIGNILMTICYYIQKKSKPIKPIIEAPINYKVYCYSHNYMIKLGRKGYKVI